MEGVTVPAAPLQQWAGQNQMPTQWTAVAGLQEGVTQFPLGTGVTQVRAKAAQQNEVGGRKRLRGKWIGGTGEPTRLSSPPLVFEIHDRPPPVDACSALQLACLRVPVSGLSGRGVNSSGRTPPRIGCGRSPRPVERQR
jgi:hypothetical protein